jgi:hypothetical protein
VQLEEGAAAAGPSAGGSPSAPPLREGSTGGSAGGASADGSSSGAAEGSAAAEGGGGGGEGRSEEDRDFVVSCRQQEDSTLTFSLRFKEPDGGPCCAGARLLLLLLLLLPLPLPLLSARPCSWCRRCCPQLCLARSGPAGGRAAAPAGLLPAHDAATLLAPPSPETPPARRMRAQPVLPRPSSSPST